MPFEVVRNIAVLTKADAQLVGGKAACLGELSHAGLPVPRGWVVSKPVIPSFVDVPGPFAIRSSAIGEDGAEFSFAGQYDTFLNVTKRRVRQMIAKCFASFDNPRAVTYRKDHDIKPLGMTVIVQEMVKATHAGTCFTIEPTYGDKQTLIVEAANGLGDKLVSGRVTPQTYYIPKILPLQAQNPGPLGELAGRVARAALEIEALFGVPQDIEWASTHHTYFGADGQLWFLQSRPITAIGSAVMAAAHVGDTILNGSPASVGVGTGPAYHVGPIRGFKTGAVLMATMTTPDLVPLMRRAAAIITAVGGRTCHAAIVSRELGIPCVVGVGPMLSGIANGTPLTVNGGEGKVYRAS